LEARDSGDRALPVPVGGLHDVVTGLAVAVEALTAARGVRVLGEVTLVQAGRIVASGRRAAVVHVDLAVLVDVLRGEVTHAVAVQVPAVQAVCTRCTRRSSRARRAGRARGAILTVIAFA